MKHFTPNDIKDIYVGQELLCLYDSIEDTNNHNGDISNSWSGLLAVVDGIDGYVGHLTANTNVHVSVADCEGNQGVGDITTNEMNGYEHFYTNQGGILILMRLDDIDDIALFEAKLTGDYEEIADAYFESWDDQIGSRFHWNLM